MSAASSSSSSNAAAVVDVASLSRSTTHNQDPVSPARYAETPSMFSTSSPDPLSLGLSFALIDLRIERGQPYFPKELIRVVHEYAAEVSFVVEFAEQSKMTQRIELDSTTAFVRWLGWRLPDAIDPAASRNATGWLSARDPHSIAHWDSCLMDEQNRRFTDLSRLLHAQLKSNEYRACYLEIDSDEDGKPFDPAIYLDSSVDLKQHDRFCLDELIKRKAAILARDQTPVSVGLSELLERVRSSFKAGVLPLGLSPRLGDWAPLFSWIRRFVTEPNERDARLRDFYCDDDYHPEAALDAVIVQLQYGGDGLSRHHTQAYLWSSDREQAVRMQPAASMIVEEQEDSEE